VNVDIPNNYRLRSFCARISRGFQSRKQPKLYLTLNSIVPSAMSTEDDYDKLSKEEREARDKADHAREAKGQAGTTDSFQS
jgi:hypothetical protein